MTEGVGMTEESCRMLNFIFLGKLQREFWVVFHLFCYNEIMDLLSTFGRPQTQTQLTFTKMEITRNKIKHRTIFISIYLIKHKAESYYEFTDIKISFVFIILAWGNETLEPF